MHTNSTEIMRRIGRVLRERPPVSPASWTSSYVSFEHASTLSNVILQLAQALLAEPLVMPIFDVSQAASVRARGLEQRIRTHFRSTTSRTARSCGPKSHNRRLIKDSALRLGEPMNCYQCTRSSHREVSNCHSFSTMFSIELVDAPSHLSLLNTFPFDSSSSNNLHRNDTRAKSPKSTCAILLVGKYCDGIQEHTSSLRQAPTAKAGTHFRSTSSSASLHLCSCWPSSLVVCYSVSDGSDAE